MIPERIQIGPFAVTVKCSSPDTQEMRHEWKDDNVWGDFTYRSMTIRVAVDATPDLQAKAFLHEILHGIAYAAGVVSDRKMTEEDFARCLAPLLLDTLRRNPELVRCLVSE